MAVAGDLLDEIDETFTLNLSNAVNATISDGARPRHDHRQRRAARSLSVDDVTVTEGDAGTVERDSSRSRSTPSAGAPSRSTTRRPTAPRPRRPTTRPPPARLDFAAGETTKTVAVPVNGDLLDEANETFIVNLANATNATIGDGQGVGTITDDDPTAGARRSAT